MKLFAAALILALAIESICFALFPGILRKAMLEASAQSDRQLRNFGVFGLVCAILLGSLVKLIGI